MRPFDKKTKELRVPWTITIENGQDKFSDSERKLGGPKAAKQKMVTSDTLMKTDRTLLGTLNRKPSEKTDFIPDDRKKRSLL